MMMENRLLAYGAVCILLLVAALAPLGAQTGGQGQAKPDALAAYRTGREMEGRNRLSEAGTYYAEAVRICNDEINKNQAGSDTYAVLTWTLQRQKKYADVISWGTKALRLYPEDLRIVEIMGEAYFYLGNYTASLNSMARYTNGLPRGDRASVAFFFAGEVYRYQKKYYRADIAYSAAVQLEPGNPLWWYRLGSVREALEDYAPAAEAYTRAVRLSPSYQEAVNGLARVRR